MEKPVGGESKANGFGKASMTMESGDKEPGERTGKHGDSQQEKQFGGGDWRDEKRERERAVNNQ